MTTSLGLNHTHLAALSSAIISGSMLYTSAAVIPTLLSTQPDGPSLVRTWNTLYRWSGGTMGPLTLLTVASYLWTALQRRRAGHHAGWRTPAAAGGLTLAVIPVSFTVMRPIYRALFAAEHRPPARGRAAALLQQWSAWNAARAMLPLAGAVLGLAAAGGREVI